MSIKNLITWGMGIGLCCGMTLTQVITHAEEVTEKETKVTKEPEVNKSLYPKKKAEIAKKIDEIKKRKTKKKGTENYQDALNMLNIFRYLCGADDNTKLNESYNKEAEKAAIACEKNGKLSHDLGEYTNICNLYMGSSKFSFENQVRGYIEDAGANNQKKRGHRRHCLNPVLNQTGFGGTSSGYGAMRIVFGKKKAKRQVSYPGKGYFPKEYMLGDGWSFYTFANEKVNTKKAKIHIWKLNSQPKKEFREDPTAEEGTPIKVKNTFNHDDQVVFEPDIKVPVEPAIYWVKVSDGANEEKYVVEFY